ncbi:hypothetical protein JTS96_21325 [Clostridium botulinum]|nr:hypothetical protein [Clostridium botulinum]
MKGIYIKEAKHGEKIDSQFMILKKIYKDGDSIIAIWEIELETSKLKF